MSSFLTGSPAAADETLDLDAVTDALQAVPDRYQVLEETPAAQAPADAIDFQPSQTVSQATQVPDSAAQIETGSGTTLVIGVPFAEDAAPIGEVDGAVVFDNENGSYSTVDPKDDGSVQITTLLTGPESPTEYVYDLALPAGATGELVNGAVIYRDSGGNFLAGVAPAWAVDANGEPVPTSYELDGDQLVQMVQHSEETAYPVVADPWLGVDLWQATYYNRNGKYKNDLVVSALFSAWGWGTYTSRAGLGIMATAGWSELVTKRPLVTGKSSLKHQYDCHVTFGYAWWWAGFHWDLEKARANKSNWLGTALDHRCNW